MGEGFVFCVCVYGPRQTRIANQSIRIPFISLTLIALFQLQYSPIFFTAYLSVTMETEMALFMCLSSCHQAFSLTQVFALSIQELSNLL